MSGASPYDCSIGNNGGIVKRMPGSERIAEFLLDTGAIRLSVDTPIALPTGKRTPIFCDYRMINDHPQASAFVVSALASRVRSLHIPPDIIAGRSRSDSGCARMVATELRLPYVQVDVSKAVPTVEGTIAGSHVVLIDDLVVSGRSLTPVIESLRGAGAIVTDVVAILAYSTPESQEQAMATSVMIHPLTTADLLITAAFHQDRLNSAAAERIRRFVSDPAQAF